MKKDDETCLTLLQCHCPPTRPRPPLWYLCQVMYVRTPNVIQTQFVRPSNKLTHAHCLQFMRISEYGGKTNIFDYAVYIKDLNVHCADNPQLQKNSFGWNENIERKSGQNPMVWVLTRAPGREARKPWVFRAGFARARDDGTDTRSTQLSTQVKDKRHFTQFHWQKSNIALKKWAFNFS